MVRKLTGIRARSPHLARALEKAFEEAHFALLESVFCHALAHGGEREFGFERNRSVSFNPRVARVALILLDLAPQVSVETVAAAMLCCADEPSSGLPEEVREIAALASRQIAAVRSDTSSVQQSAILVKLSLHLDRVRQYHRCAESRSAENAAAFIREARHYVELAAEFAPSFVPFFTSWEERFMRRIGR